MILSNKTSAGSGCCKCLAAPWCSTEQLTQSFSHTSSLFFFFFFYFVIVVFSWRQEHFHASILNSVAYLARCYNKHTSASSLRSAYLLNINKWGTVSSLDEYRRLHLPINPQRSSHLTALLRWRCLQARDMWVIVSGASTNRPPKLLPSAGTQRGSSPFLDWRLSTVKYGGFFYLQFPEP